MRMSLAASFILMCLGMLQLNCLRHHVEIKEVPPGFEYPEYGTTIQYKQVLLFQRVAGTVVAPTGDGLSEVLVEIQSADQKERIAAMFTDTHGNFQFDNLKEGEYFIRLSKPLFSPLQANIKVAKSGKRSFKFIMMVA